MANTLLVRMFIVAVFFVFLLKSSYGCYGGDGPSKLCKGIDNKDSYLHHSIGPFSSSKLQIDEMDGLGAMHLQLRGDAGDPGPHQDGETAGRERG